MSAEISVIMPLYNKKNYLQLAADSVLNQTFANIELLIVDDCSTDGSLELCRELYGHDSRVRIIQQPKNMGPGAARNTGIRSASGDYVVFWDSDDEVLPGALSQILDVAKKYNADVVHNTQFLLPIPDEDGNMPIQLVDDSVKFFPISSNLNGDDYTEITRLSDDMAARLDDWRKRRINWSVCSKMIRRKFLMDNNIYFSDMKFGEDRVFCFECLFKAKNYVILPGGNYVCRVISSSLTRGKKSSAYIVTALKSEFEAIRVMTKAISEIPFFVQNPKEAVREIENDIDDINRGYVRPAFNELGEEALRSDNRIHDFMSEKFGDKAPYVEFLFYELHRIYEPVVDYIGLLGDVEYLRSLAKSFREKEQGQK